MLVIALESMKRTMRRKKPEPTMKRSVFPSRETVCARIHNEIYRGPRMLASMPLTTTRTKKSA